MKDLIIDCFAGGGGASVGIEMALGRPVDIAINHDPDAILMHKTNHPDTLHLTEDIFRVDLKKYVKGQHVALMWASPDCTSHNASGRTASTASSTIATMIGTRGATMGYRTSFESSPGSDRGTVL